jgi:hypothetical protein
MYPPATAGYIDIKVQLHLAGNVVVGVGLGYLDPLDARTA